ncbi:MAG: DUF2384 domain-containing protein [Deltaproteobacteria bacterium]|nr:DUF2384 domain-containing protein [Deltaproteobacteria bacterium]
MATSDDWTAFHERLMAIYWPSLAPHERLETRPEAPPDEPQVPDDIWQVAFLVFPDTEAWLHNPIPNLQRRSALQVIGDGEADAVRAILMEVAPFMLPPPSEMTPWTDD